MRLRVVVIGLLALSSLIDTATTADRPGDRSVAEQVVLKNGTRLRGLLFERTPQQVTMLLSSKWLRAANPKLCDSASAKTAAEHSSGLEQLIDRLQTEKANRAGPAVLTGFLQQQLEAAEQELKESQQPLMPEFLWMTWPAREVERVELAASDRRQALAWSWVEQLDRPETRSYDELIRELKNRAVSPVGWPPSLIERLPAREQSEREWAARMAIVEFVFDKPIHFQGTGDVLLRADKTDQFQIAQVLGELLKQQLTDQLGDLLGEPAAAKNRDHRQASAAFQDAIAKAAKTAESESSRGFRVTRLESVQDADRSGVTTLFLVRLPDRSWQTIFQHSERADAKQPRPDILKRIEDDPRVKQVLDLARQFGGATDEPIQKALRFGAATMAAQQACDAEFASFRELFLKSLAKPPLVWQREAR